MEHLIEHLIEYLGGVPHLTATLSVGTLVAARIGPLTVLLPWLALRGAPALLRTAIVLALTLAMFPVTAAATVELPSSPYVLSALALREVVIGAIFALAAGLPFFALDWSGRLVDTWRGASLAEVIAPPTGERTSPLGDLWLLGGIALFLSLGGHRLALAAFAEGLAVAPVGDVAFGQDTGEAILMTVRLSATAIAFSAAIAAPAAVAIVLVEVGLGLIARSAPQIPVFFAGMPLRAATGLAAVLLAASLVVADLPDVFAAATHAASQQLERLAP
ncbi:MAG: hypothetical protein DRJ42_12690 [Deltaproteobacteria bacterium]|nr:MAG: hypothetical protein DRJ42_12690 [Deltaproteobacteria bacterium]